MNEQNAVNVENDFSFRQFASGCIVVGGSLYIAIDGYASGFFSIWTSLLFLVGLVLFALIIKFIKVATPKDPTDDDFNKKDQFVLMQSIGFVMFFFSMLNGTFTYYSGYEFSKKVDYLSEYGKFYDLAEQAWGEKLGYQYQKDINALAKLSDEMPFKRISNPRDYRDKLSQVQIADYYFLRLNHGLQSILDQIKEDGKLYPQTVETYANEITGLSLEGFSNSPTFYKYLSYVISLIKGITLLSIAFYLVFTWHQILLANLANNVKPK